MRGLFITIMLLINHVVKSDDKSHEVSGRKGADSQDIVTEVSTNDHVEDLNNLKVTNPPPVVTTTTTVAPIKTTKIPRIKTTTVAKSSRFVFFYFFLFINCQPSFWWTKII